MTPKRVRTVKGSCWLCKDRRVLCDLQQPRCSRCISKGEPCEYGEVRLRWCNGVAARGRYAGQNVPVSMPSMNNSKESHGNTLPLQSNERLEQEQQQQQRDGWEIPEDQAFSPVYCNSLQLSQLSSHVTDDQLLLYFANEVVDRFSLSTGQISINLPSVYEEPVLRDSVSAVAKAHHVFSLYPGGADVALAKKRARWSAIHKFRTRLESPSMESKAPGLDLFMANVLLCILDGVIDPHDESAATHMHYRGGRAIFSQWKLEKQLFQEKRGLPALMLSVFATMDLTYSMLSGEEQYLQHTIWNGFADSDCWWGVLPQGDPFLGIMSTLSRLTRLGSLVSKGFDPPRDILNEELNTLLMALRVPRQTPDDISCLEIIDMDDQSSSPLSSVFISPDHLHLDRDQSWAVFCDAYRISGLLYAYRVFYRLEVGDPLVQQTVNLGIQAVCKTQLTGKLSHCLLFPALVIGSHCQSKEDQTAMLATLQSTAAFLRFGSLRVMESFLHGVWGRDMTAETWWQCFEPISKKAFLF